MECAVAVCFLVDGVDCVLEHEAHRGAARGRQRLRNRPLDVLAQAIEAGLGGNELLLELGAPSRMSEVAGADHPDAPAARPGGEGLEIAVPAPRPRIFPGRLAGRVE